MILFKKLRYKNFLSTGNVFTEIDYLQHRTTLIMGVNGSGKSTNLDALTFALYNKAYRNINKPALVNSINRKDCITEVEFSIGSTQYRVVRGIKPAVFEIYKNEKLMNPPSDNRDYQQILENQILKMSYKTFCQVVILGTSNYVPFMQLTPQSRREIIEDLLDLEIFSTMGILLKEKIVQNNDELQKVHNNIELLNEKYNLSLQYEKKHNENIKKLALEFLDKINDVKKSIDCIDEEILIRESTVNDLNSKQKEIQTKLDELMKYHEINRKFELKKNQIVQELDFFTHNDSCPTCRQFIEEKYKCEAIDSRQTFIEKSKPVEKEISEKLYTYNELQNEVSQINKKIWAENSQISILLSNKQLYNSNIDNLKKQMYDLKNMKVSEQETMNKEYIQNQINELHEEKRKLNEQKLQYSICQNVLKDTGIKSKIVKQYIPIINTLINKYLHALNFYCQFELDENFNEKIKSRFRDDFTYNSFSEGEKSRINLAILFSWRQIAKMRNASATNLILLDEILDQALDSSGAEDFIKILNENADEHFNAFVISHKTDQLGDVFENLIKVEKVKNFSVLS